MGYGPGHLAPYAVVCGDHVVNAADLARLSGMKESARDSWHPQIESERRIAEPFGVLPPFLHHPEQAVQDRCFVMVIEVGQVCAYLWRA